MKKLLILALFLWLSLPAFAQSKEVNLTAIDYQPFTGENLKNGGFLSEVTTEAFKREGYTVKFFYRPWARGIKESKQGDWDGMTGLWYRKDREKWFIFSPPLASNEITFVKRKNTQYEFKGYKDLIKQNLKIGVVRGYANPPKFDKVIDQLNISVAREDILNLRKLGKGRIDLVVIDKLVGKYLIATKMPEFIDAFNFMDPPLKVDPLYIGFSKNAPGIKAKAEAFKRGFTKIESDGTYQKILLKHGF